MSAQTFTGLKRKVYLVDDHPILREGFAQLINLQHDLQVCGQSDNTAQALSEIPVCKPDLVIVDISLKGANGIELIKQLKILEPQSRVLVLSVHDEGLYAERALRSGAKGYVMKQAPTTEVLEAIRKVAQGGRYVSRNLQDRLLQHLSDGAPPSGPTLACLSDRELEVFQLIGSGLSTREIGHRLHLSVKTVETYRAHIKQKLGLDTGLDLLRMAVEVENRAQQTKSDGESSNQ